MESNYTPRFRRYLSPTLPNASRFSVTSYNQSSHTSESSIPIAPWAQLSQNITDPLTPRNRVRLRASTTNSYSTRRTWRANTVNSHLRQTRVSVGANDEGCEKMLHRRAGWHHSRRRDPLRHDFDLWVRRRVDRVLAPAARHHTGGTDGGDALKKVETPKRVGTWSG